MYLGFFIIVNLLAIFFFYLMIKKYGQLTSLLKQHQLNNQDDIFSFGFINKVFLSFPQHPHIQKVQRQVVKHAVYAGLLLVIGRYLIKFV